MNEYAKRVKAIENLPSNQMFFWQSYGFVGNCINFWAKGGAGYTTKLEKAELFTKEQTLAQLACRRGQDVFWKEEDIRKALSFVVDVQDLKDANSF